MAADASVVQTPLNRPYLLTLSSPDEDSLLDDLETLCDELMEEDIELCTKAHDLSSQHIHDVRRAFVVTRDIEVESDDFSLGVVDNDSPARVCLLFTGQG